MTLAVRVIPCLDVDAGRVVKGVNFRELRDAGDPVELARLYDAEGADELTFLDISASHEGRATTLDIVSRSTGATVVHCAAGKDRTGTVVALALDAAGVPHDAIVEDYALTAERIERIIARLMPRELYGNALKKQSVADQSPRPETMQTILDTVQSEFGGATGWLTQQGWSTADIERLRARLTT